VGPDDILRWLEPQLKNSRVTHFGLLHRLAGMSTEVSHSSLGLYVKEVMPVLKTWGREPVSGTGSRPPAAVPTI
jgi:hypothetical protein